MKQFIGRTLPLLLLARKGRTLQEFEQNQTRELIGRVGAVENFKSSVANGRDEISQRGINPAVMPSDFHVAPLHSAASQANCRYRLWFFLGR